MARRAADTQEMDGFGLYLAVAVATLASGAAAAGAVGRLTRWSRAASWFVGSVLLVPCWVGAGLWLGDALYTDDCSEWCTTSWFGFLFGALTACAELVIALLAGLMWLGGRRGSRAGSVQPM